MHIQYTRFVNRSSTAAFFCPRGNTLFSVILNLIDLKKQKENGRQPFHPTDFGITGIFRICAEGTASNRKRVPDTTKKEDILNRMSSINRHSDYYFVSSSGAFPY